jgi:hypothetical protein
VVAYVRKVRTALGAVAVQVVRKHRGQRTILAHVGSAHTDAQLGILIERARRMAAEDQGVLDIEVAARTQSVDEIADWRAGELIPAKGAPAPPGRTAASHSRLLYDVLGAVYDWLGFDEVDDGVFRDLVIARIVEPTSKVDASRVLTDLGADTVSYRTIQRHLVRVNTGKNRDASASKCFTHAADRGGLSLLLYDVTTLPERHISSEETGAPQAHPYSYSPAPAAVDVGPETSGYWAGQSAGCGAAAQGLVTLAREADEIVGGEDAALLRECGRLECTQVYLDRSRGYRRQWCDENLRQPSQSVHFPRPPCVVTRTQKLKQSRPSRRQRDSRQSSRRCLQAPKASWPRCFRGGIPWDWRLN